MADVCDLAHAVLLEQFEGDERAAISGGASERSVADARQALEDALVAEPKRVKHIPADELALRRSLGVA